VYWVKVETSSGHPARGRRAAPSPPQRDRQPGRARLRRAARAAEAEHRAVAPPTAAAGSPSWWWRRKRGKFPMATCLSVWRLRPNLWPS